MIADSLDCTVYGAFDENRGYSLLFNVLAAGRLDRGTTDMDQGVLHHACKLELVGWWLKFKNRELRVVQFGSIVSSMGWNLRK